MTIISSSNGNSASSRTPRAGTSGPIRSSRTTEFGSRSCGLGGRCFPETDRKADSTSSVPTKSVGLSTSRLPRGTARVARNSAPVGFIADLIASACSRRLDDISTVPRRAALSRSALSAYISNAVRWTSVRSPKGLRRVIATAISLSLVAPESRAGRDQLRLQLHLVDVRNGLPTITTG